MSGATPSTSTPSTTRFECDIGDLLKSDVKIQQLSRDKKYLLITTEPNCNASTYPRTRPNESRSYRQFQPSWMKQYPWLHYSQFADGAFCRTCAIFAPKSVGGQGLGTVCDITLPVLDEHGFKGSYTCQ